MDFTERIEQVAEQVREQKDFIKSGESTRGTFVDPFVDALGYDRYDPEQVAPDFEVRGAGETGQSVDYALLDDGAPAILIDCKPAGTALSRHQARQLVRGLQATEARVGLLTNGVEYHFFCDRQRVDQGPFFEFDLLQYSVLEVEALRRLHASTLDLDHLISRLYEPNELDLRDNETSTDDAGASAGGGGGVLEVIDTVVGGVVKVVKVVAGTVVFIIGAFVALFIVAEIYDEDGEQTAQSFVERRSQVLETVESDIEAGQFRTAMDTADKYLEHVQDRTLQALRDEAEWATRHEEDAWNACTDAVKKRLQRSSSACFPRRRLADTIAYLRDRRFRIRAHVNPDTSSEETGTMPFTCVVTTASGKGWTLQSIEMNAR